MPLQATSRAHYSYFNMKLGYFVDIMQYIITLRLFQTLFLGIMDGRFSKTLLCHLVPTDEAFADVRKQIQAVDCLILDEASMISAHTFEQASHLFSIVQAQMSLFKFVYVVSIYDNPI